MTRKDVCDGFSFSIEFGKYLILLSEMADVIKKFDGPNNTLLTLRI